jgi:hypothetical protein
MKRNPQKIKSNAFVVVSEKTLLGTDNKNESDDPFRSNPFHSETSHYRRTHVDT